MKAFLITIIILLLLALAAPDLVILDDVVTEHKQGSLTLTDLIHKETEEKYKDLITGNWAHENIDGCDLACRTKDMNRTGYQWYGENLYKGEKCDLVRVMELWLDSPKHKEVLEHDYTNGVLLIKTDPKTDTCYIVLNVTN